MSGPTLVNKMIQNGPYLQAAERAEEKTDMSTLLQYNAKPCIQSTRTAQKMEQSLA